MKQDIYTDFIYTSATQKVWPTSHVHGCHSWRALGGRNCVEYGHPRAHAQASTPSDAGWAQIRVCTDQATLFHVFFQRSLWEFTPWAPHGRQHPLLVPPPCPMAFSVTFVHPPPPTSLETYWWYPRSSPCPFSTSEHSLGSLKCSLESVTTFKVSELENHISCLQSCTDSAGYLPNHQNTEC